MLTQLSVLPVIAAATLFALFGTGGARTTQHGEAHYGAFGPEGQRLREQLWVIPGADPKIPLRATVFRPRQTDNERRPMVVINHGSDDETREAVSMPIFYWLSKWFVDRGYVVMLPQRRGHGATGGAMAEGRDSCSDPDHYGAGLAAADDIETAVRYMSAQPFVDAKRIVVVGVSTGGWASLGVASRNLPGVGLIVNFAGGRGAHAYGRPREICGVDRLIEASGRYARNSTVPTLWFYAANDSYFGPDLATSMAHAWANGGGTVDLRLLPTHRREGHEIASDKLGWKVWGSALESSLAKFNLRHLPPA